MRAHVTQGLKLIAWGDNGWATDMAERAGEHIDYIAAHHDAADTGAQGERCCRGVDYQARRSGRGRS
jgi:hypothetical protein